MKFNEIEKSLLEGKAARLKSWLKQDKDKRIRIFKNVGICLFQEGKWKQYSLIPKELKSKDWELIDYQVW